MTNKIEIEWQVSFDGHGFNDRLAEYGPRLATLTEVAKDTSFGKFAEKAINGHKKNMDLIATLADFLEEAHQEEIDSNHSGDGKRGCSYCKAIAQAKQALG